MEVHMVRKQFVNKIFFTFFLICWMVYAPTYAEDIGLVDLLSGQLGITKNQAEAGAGSIFQLAEKNLSVEDFASVAKVIPGIEQMMAAAPKEDVSSGAFGGISSKLGSASDMLGGMAGLKSSFGKLGLSGDMVGEFVPIILDYVKKKGGERVMNLLKGALM
jgi:hypothetical protein